MNDAVILSIHGQRYRGDMIELFKIVNGKYNSARIPHFEFMELSDNLIRTRGNRFKLVQHHCHYDLRKYNFTNRVIPIWNSSSNFVFSAGTINTVNKNSSGDEIANILVNDDIAHT